MKPLNLIIWEIHHKEGPKQKNLLKMDPLLTWGTAYVKCKAGGAQWYIFINPQEDATIAAVEFDTNSSVFGVMDGHGGNIKIINGNKLNRLTNF